MPFLGNRPAENYISYDVQHFTTSATTSYTLDHAVANENELRLVINNVVQQPGSSYAYSASGTSLTLTSATSATDTMYCVYLGKATSTVNPPSGSVGSSQLASDAVTTAKITDLNVTTAKIAADAITEAKIADDAVESEHLNNNVISGQTELAVAPASTDELLISDGGVLKRIDFSLIGGSNTPAFSAYITSNQTCSDSTETTVNFDAEDFDTNSAYDTTNKRFTVPSGEAGKYFIFSRVRFSALNLASQVRIQIRKNGSGIKQAYTYSGGVGTNLYNFTNDNGHLFHEISTLVDLSVGDYIDIGVLVDTNSANYLVQEGSLRGEFSGYKLIE